MIFSKTTSRLISFLMAVVMLVGMFPMQSFAAEGDAAGVYSPISVDDIEVGKSYLIVANDPDEGYLALQNSSDLKESVTVSDGKITLTADDDDLLWTVGTATDKQTDNNKLKFTFFNGDMYFGRVSNQNNLTLVNTNSSNTKYFGHVAEKNTIGNYSGGGDYYGLCYGYNTDQNRNKDEFFYTTSESKYNVTLYEKTGEVSGHECTFGGDYFQEDGKHYQKCECGNTSEKVACSGGTATCKDQAVCDICEKPYGALSTEHKYDNGSCTVCGTPDPNAPVETVEYEEIDGNIAVGQELVIVANYNGTNYALKNNNGKAAAFTEVAVSGEKVTFAEAEEENLLWTVGEATGNQTDSNKLKFTFTNNGYYAGRVSNDNNLNLTNQSGTDKTQYGSKYFGHVENKNTIGNYSSSGSYYGLCFGYNTDQGRNKDEFFYTTSESKYNVTFYVKVESEAPHVCSWGEYIQENDQHYQKCTDPSCDKTTEKVACSGGTATCEAPAVCGTCHNTYGSKLSHSMTKTEAKAATCLVDGNNEYWTCSLCEKVYKDEAGTQVTTVEAEATTADHVYDETAWGYKGEDGHAHVCKTEGCNEHDTVAAHTPGAAATETTAQTCTVCEYVITPATGHVNHDYSVPVSETAATCTQAGTKVMKCSGCDKTETTTLAIDPSNHTYGDLIAKVETVHTATELKAGMEAHYKCACGKFFTAEKVETTEAALAIAAPTHSFGNEWKSNDEQHWHECSCGAKDAVADHSFTTGDCACGKKAPAQPEQPSGQPEKVTELKDGKYIIASGTKAMTSEKHDGYMNTNNYGYVGFKGTDITVANNKITSSTTADMVWEVKSVSGGYTIKHVASGKYLTATYVQNSGNSGYTGTLALTDTAEDTWVLESNFRLKSTKASNNNKGSTLYLTFDDKPDTISNGTANLFGIRSNSNSYTNVDTIDFYAVPDHEHTWGTVSYTWADNGSACTAERTCTATDPAHKETAAAAITSKVTTAATCKDKGTTTYTATFSEAWATTQTKEVQDVPVTDEHNYVNGVCSVCQKAEPEKPNNPVKVTALEAGQYIIANGSNALTTKVHSGYTNNSSYSYSGFEGAAVTITGNEITAGATEDMVFELKASGNGFTIQHVESGKYLTASYTQNSNNSGWTGTLTLSTTAEVWEWNSSNGYLKSTNASTSSKGLYLVFDDVNNNVSSGTQDNLFGIRSDGNSGNNLDKIDFYKIGKEIVDEEVKVTGVTLGKAEAEMTVGDSLTLAVSVAPDNATNKNVTWTSSDASVATVDANGKITAVKEGNVTITVTTADGGFTATCAITVKAAQVPGGNGNGETVYVAFSSDIHSKTTSKTDSTHSPYRLNNWLTGVSGVISADLEEMVFCGDNADGTGASNGDDYWAKAGAAMDVAAENAHLKTEGLFLAGNHEWENGSLGNTSSLGADAQARAAKIQPVGKVVTDDNYILYLFGASSSSQSGTGFKTEDLTALDNYLSTAPTDRPIFIASHFPIHNFSSRSTKNADQMIATLNKYGDKLDLYFIWGHNHSQSDSNYDKFFDDGDTLLNREINFVYCAAGAMSDSEYQGSGNVKGKGLVAKIVSGKVESLTYYGTSFTATGSYKPDYTVDPDEPVDPDTPVIPDEPGKVEKLEDGFYVIANDTHALTTEEHTGYTNNSGYSYSGFEGAEVTIEGDKITAGATEDMVFEVKASGTGYTIQHVETGKYLAATYTQNSGADSYTGRLYLSDTAEVWEWDSTTGYLKHPGASNNGRNVNLYLVYDNVDNNVSTGSQKNMFGIRSDSNDGKNMDRIDFYVINVNDDHTHKYNAVVTAPTCTEEGYTTYTCSCGDSFRSDTKPALGHTEVTDPAVAATCTVDGLTEGKHCSVCEVVIIAQTPVVAQGHQWDDGVVTREPSAAEPGIKTYTCTVCEETETEEIPYEAPVVTGSVQRISGKDRVKTALSVAKALKDTLKVDKFNAVIIATGMNEKFADALAGSYLANVKGAPILLYNGGSSLSALNVTFIQENLKANGTVYILGGTGAIPATVEEPLSAYNVVRLSGKTRYETNLAILKEAGVASASEILIATGTNFADSLSASAVGLPLLLVNGKGTSLNDVQTEFLKTMAGKKVTIIGGTGAVSEEMEAAIEAVVGVEAERISGKTRHNTSVLIAQKYFPNADSALITYALNFPDGLAGGPLAYAMGAPLLLTQEGKESIANEYIAAEDIESGYVLGGDAAVSDATARKAFGLADDAVINKAYYTE